jgi:hypothetical protein
METLFTQWAARVPRYDKKYVELFEQLAQKGSTSERTKGAYGRTFSSFYELYIYAFFLGLYNNAIEPFPDGAKLTDFSHAIEHWGNKGGKLMRKDYSVIRRYIFAGTILNSDVDLLKLERNEIDVKDVTRELLDVTEAIANGGLRLLRDKLDENSDYFTLHPMGYVEFIIGAKD